MGALSRDPTAVHNQNQVRIPYGGRPLGDDDLCRAAQFACKCLPDFRVRGGVYGAGGVIQNQDLGLF